MKRGRSWFFSLSIGILKDSLKGFVQHRGPQNAAMIAYFATLSLIPFFVLLTAVVGQVLHMLGPHYGSEKDLMALIFRALKDFSPRIAAQIMPRIKEMISARNTIGLVGFTVLFFSAGLVFEGIESSLRVVFNPEKKRHILFSRVLFFVFFAALGFLMVVIYFLLSLAKPWIAAMGHTSVFEVFARYRALDIAISLLLLGGGFMVIVSHFSSKKLKLKALLYGGGLFFLLFETARYLFSYYIGHIARFDWVYGSLATVMIGAIWIYYSALIFLFCAEFTRAIHQNA